MARTLVGRYELEVPLGRGASGEVWRGRDLATRQPVAIKLIELAVIDDPVLLTQMTDRFRREARVLDALSHPNIVAARDAGRAGNYLFLVMDLVNGISLASFRDERADKGMGLFPVASVLDIARQVSAGLAAAHAAGVVHRDIKPGNLMVTLRLGVTIIDFGIARLLDDNSPRLTLPRHAIGTLAYMSPEQARDGHLDGRADLYSLGCVLYELLAGRPPFRAATADELLTMQLRVQAVPLSVIRPALPPGLPELVGDLMQKDRAARPAGAAQVISRLEAISRSLGGTMSLGGGGGGEADRETTRPGARPAPAVPSSPGAATPEADRVTARPGERPDEPVGQEIVVTPAWAPHTPATDEPVPAPPRQELSQQALSRQAPPRYLPEARAKGAGTPPWPGAPGRRRRRIRWGRALSSLLTVAIVAGAGAYFWARHEAFKVTNIQVMPPNEFVRCDGTAHVTAMIATSGRGGVIKVNWIERIPGVKETVVPGAYTADSDGMTEVYLNWAIHGKGTFEATVELQVTEPDQGLAPKAAFPYHCPS